MSPEQFTYWLQGFMEVQDPTTLDARQTQILKEHLALVFNKVTPVRPTAPPNEEVHRGTGKVREKLAPELQALVDSVAKDLSEGRTPWRGPQRLCSAVEKKVRPILRCFSPDRSSDGQVDNRTYC